MVRKTKRKKNKYISIMLPLYLKGLMDPMNMKPNYQYKKGTNKVIDGLMNPKEPTKKSKEPTKKSKIDSINDYNLFL